MWAVRMGHAKLYVPRSPSPGPTGHREHWLDLDPRALAICLGLLPVDTAKQPESPFRHVWRMCYSKAPSPRGMCMWAWGIMLTASHYEVEIPVADWGSFHAP